MVIVKKIEDSYHLDIIRKKIRRDKCSCGANLLYMPIKRFYPHPNPSLPTLYPNSWVFVECQECGYQWNIWKLMRG